MALDNLVQIDFEGSFQSHELNMAALVYLGDANGNIGDDVNGSHASLPGCLIKMKKGAWRG